MSRAHTREHRLRTVIAVLGNWREESGETLTGDAVTTVPLCMGFIKMKSATINDKHVLLGRGGEGTAGFVMSAPAEPIPRRDQSRDPKATGAGVESSRPNRACSSVNEKTATVSRSRCCQNVVITYYSMSIYDRTTLRTTNSLTPNSLILLASPTGFEPVLLP